MIKNPKQKIGDLLEEEKELIAYGALRTHLSKFYKNGVPTISENFDFMGNSHSYSYINSYIFNTFARSEDLFKDLKSAKYCYLSLDALAVYGVYVKNLFENLIEYKRKYPKSSLNDFIYVCNKTARDIYSKYSFLKVKPNYKNSSSSFQRLSTTAFAYYIVLFGDELDQVINEKIKESFNYLKPEFQPNIKVYASNFLNNDRFSSFSHYEKICKTPYNNTLPLIYEKETQKVENEPEQLSLFDYLDKK